MKKILFYLLLFILSLGLVGLIVKILPYTDYTNAIIGRILVIFLIILILYKRKNLSIFSWRNNFFKGVYLGKWLFIAIIANLLTTFRIFGNIDFTIITLFLLLASNFTIALFEEILARGIIFNGLLKKYSLIKSSLLSSLIFGLVHLLNLTHSNDIIGVFTQVIYAFFLGLLLASVYYKTENLWVTVFLHFLLNLSSGFEEISNLGGDVKDNHTNIFSALIMLLIMLPAYISGRKILNKN